MDKLAYSRTVLGLKFKQETHKQLKKQHKQNMQ